jgi:hypothetical protein
MEFNRSLAEGLGNFGVQLKPRINELGDALNDQRI